MPDGLFGTRADLLMDAGITLLTSMPLLMLWAFRLARRRRHTAHRNVQSATLAIVLVVLVIFEIDLRMRGGSAFIDQFPERAAIVRAVLKGHIVVATATFFAWFGLGLISWTRFSKSLPGTFSRLHKSLGKATFVGACLVSVSGAAIYALLYVL